MVLCTPGANNLNLSSEKKKVHFSALISLIKSKKRLERTSFWGILRDSAVMSSLLLHVMRLGDSNSERRFGAGFKMENKGEIRGQMLSNFLTSSCSATPTRCVGRSKESFDSFHVHVRFEIPRMYARSVAIRAALFDSRPRTREF